MPQSIYLTFDDGPNQPYTGQILEILNRYGAKATFFVCGKNAERDPGTVRRIIEAGHTLGNHAYSHSKSLAFSVELYEEFVHTAEILSGIAGTDAGPGVASRGAGGRGTDAHGTDGKIIRAPWGLMSPGVRERLLAEGFKIYHWDLAAFDWWQPPASYIVRRIVRPAHDGAIVLLHDGEKTSSGSSRAKTVAALPQIIEQLSARGFEFKAL